MRDHVEPGFADLGFARLDTDRAARTGHAEVIYGAGKTVRQALDLLAALRGAHPELPALLTRADEPMRRAVADRYGPQAWLDAEAGAVAVGPLPRPRGTVRVVSAGTSDNPVAAEAAFTARVFGAAADRICDVGVAGVHRLLAARDRLVDADCLVVVAGMDGALPSVVGGLVGVPVVAVPTSVGYGASFGGLAALLAMLNSCAPGVVVVNIDNGFGAGVFAARVARAAARADPMSQPAPQSESDRGPDRGPGPA
ncbi:MAG TPA: nickel pincer cofactor biosynthesis protein LarB [Mycobacteriales bacterium]|nr:nickel pincer cofactor biosynthesis protein LarB [Mycobacteriales bacterium]